jgi:hypothetical protein
MSRQKPIRKQSGWWQCGYGHIFQFGQEDWHHGDAEQGWDPDYVIPRYCDHVDAETREPCMDSTVLEGPFTDSSCSIPAKQRLGE